ncbi:MAG: TetR/AcrR family transcriptional regulator [Lachnospiraceae bacterium]|nr:TetR/AcrR family transcriptional regulator [Lachnospiraceae bacterium]
MANGKEAEERKKEILDAAEELFIARGYDETSTSDILEKVGIARGTLYYHFKSKEEILDALIDRIMQEAARRMNAALSGKEDVLHKVILFMGAVKLDSAIGKEITDYAHKPQNALMHQKIQKALLTVMTPMVAKIIKDGIADGSIKTDYPEETAEMILIYSSVAFDDLEELAPEEKARKAMAFVSNLERLLGMKKGSLSGMLQYI